MFEGLKAWWEELWTDEFQRANQEFEPGRIDVEAITLTITLVNGEKLYESFRGYVSYEQRWVSYGDSFLQRNVRKIVLASKLAADWRKHVSKVGIVSLGCGRYVPIEQVAEFTFKADEFYVDNIEPYKLEHDEP